MKVTSFNFFKAKVLLYPPQHLLSLSLHSRAVIMNEFSDLSHTS